MAALLIARQVISNLKESAVPYLIEQLRLARLSFEMFGALSPSEARSPPEDAAKNTEDAPDTDKVKDKDKEDKDKKEDKAKQQTRSISQAELESSLYRVGHSSNSLLSDFTLKVWF